MKTDIAVARLNTKNIPVTPEALTQELNTMQYDDSAVDRLPWDGTAAEAEATMRELNSSKSAEEWSEKYQALLKKTRPEMSDVERAERAEAMLKIHKDKHEAKVKALVEESKDCKTFEEFLAMIKRARPDLNEDETLALMVETGREMGLGG
jgi:uncharacterized protein YdiU (UPF0061 family)